MKYVSIDLETTGLNDETDSILSIGLVIEDTKNLLPFDEIPKLHLYIQKDRIEGSLFAVNMNRAIIEKLCDYSQLKSDEAKEAFCNLHRIKVVKEDDAVAEIHAFLWDNGIRYDDSDKYPPKHMRRVGETQYPVIDIIPRTYINVAGKNFASFDNGFLERLPKWKRTIGVRRRMMDPSQNFVDWSVDEDLPGLSLCKKRAGLDDHVSHDAVDDAWDVIQLMRISTVNYKINYNSI